jgi:hypothetical protein
MIMNLDLDKARAEIREKAKRQIEAETAATWAARAIAAWELAAETRHARWFVEAAQYEHEAVEHAAEAGPEEYAATRDAIARARAALGLGEL